MRPQVGVKRGLGTDRISPEVGSVSRVTVPCPQQHPWVVLGMHLTCPWAVPAPSASKAMSSSKDGSRQILRASATQRPHSCSQRPLMSPPGKRVGKGLALPPDLFLIQGFHSLPLVFLWRLFFSPEIGLLVVLRLLPRVDGRE